MKIARDSAGRLAVELAFSGGPTTGLSSAHNDVSTNHADTARRVIPASPTAELKEPNPRELRKEALGGATAGPALVDRSVLIRTDPVISCR